MRIMLKRTAANRRKGAALIEASLALMPLLCTVMFIVDMGRILVTEQYITERARAGLRQAVVSTWYNNPTSIKNYICYNATTPPNGATQGMFGLKPSQITVTTLGTNGTPNYRLQVQVSGLQMFSFIPLMSHNYTAPPITITMPMQSEGATI